ncbi:CynX/NimT family MFS transporter [Gaiella sp.]|uniref:MFS transporter n=1 Tax=Gaiella sp. TaxID=2663207 RepID=UPI003983BF31
MTNRANATLIALFLAALTLRPQIVGVGPLIPSIQDAFGTSHAVVGLLGTIPVLCMGLFAPVAAYLAAKIGTRRAMTIGLALIGVFGILRATVPSAWLVVLLTWPVGIGMGLGNALAPISVKEHFEKRPATGTGVYTTGIQIGSTSSAALAVPLAAWFGGWRGALIAISCVALFSLVAWVILTRGEEPHAAPAATVPRLPWRSGTAWLLVAIFALMGSAYYGLNAWLPDAYAERGWTAGEAGVLLAMMNLTAIPASFLIPWLSDRTGRRSPFLLGLSCFFITGSVILVAAPGIAYLGSLLAGIAQGGLFALVMTLPLDFERTPARVGALVAMMLGLGYTIAATSPFILGAIRDVTGSFDAVLWVAAAFLMAQFFALLALTRRHPSARPV